MGWAGRPEPDQVHRRTRHVDDERGRPADHEGARHVGQFRTDGIALYPLVMASLMLTGAKIGKIHGAKKVFRISLWIYGVGTLIAAFSWSIEVLALGWSLIEGIAAAALVPLSMSLIIVNYRGAKRALAFGILGGFQAPPPWVRSSGVCDRPADMACGVRLRGRDCGRRSASAICCRPARLVGDAELVVMDPREAPDHHGCRDDGSRRRRHDRGHQARYG